ncbi:hypothetical protein C5B85_14320 [Pseudoclavibacter sp. AY1F1]|uniref:hypothetical protein n=1 Tax=Pseudoclavibacter sp. AY1F1 TaxID=2080583 RepID=UPI000CE8E6DC|nr:hypothetical protein [Pseudoclavibacter sp. AY1F1]PPF43128.1 hypothetical protein C5B85_14320 [Pseudoclavibacter sp. AY1F1]
MTKLTPTDDFATRPIELPRISGLKAEGLASPSLTCVEHGWATASRHSTSLGIVIYSTCGTCGAYRAEILASDGLFPQPISDAIVAPNMRGL